MLRRANAQARTKLDAVRVTPSPARYARHDGKRPQPTLQILARLRPPQATGGAHCQLKLGALPACSERGMRPQPPLSVPGYLPVARPVPPEPAPRAPT